MRPPACVIVLLVALATALSGGTARAQQRGRGAEGEDLSRARALDKEGAKAYGEGRYEDAIRAFEEAYRLGGPAFELWNVAKCHLRLERPSLAAEMLERYLSLPNLPKGDREEASQQLEALRKRPSALTVSSARDGAEVLVDGKRAGRTPLSISVRPGTHTVTVKHGGEEPYTREVEARYGRALTVDASARASPEERDERRPPPPPNPYDEATSAPIALRAGVGLAFPRWGTIGGRAGAGFLALGTYRVAEVGGVAIGVGGLFSAATDSWDDRTGSPSEAAGCASPITDAESATALSLFGIGTASLPIGPLRGAAIAGLGLAAYSVDDIGGDLFVPSCRPSPGIVPALLLGVELDWAPTSRVRLSAFPLTWQVQPSFDGTRAAPRDASGIWMRLGIAVGAGVDL